MTRRIYAPSSRILRRVRASRGYTAIEVLLAMTVLLIGSAGVMTMQKASIQGNLDARKLDIANSIAHDWLERLTADMSQWTLPSANVTGASNIGNTTWIQNYSTSLPGTPFLPAIPTTAAAAEAQSPAFDILGRGLTQAGAANAVFCVHVNIVPMAWSTSALIVPPIPTLLRATVLVFWPKQLVNSGAVPAGYCAPGSVLDPAAAEAASPGTWHLLYTTTALRKSN